MLKEIDECASNGESFAFETTLSGLNYLQRIKDWKLQGYAVKIWFISLDSADIAVSRVAERVRQGGHNIPEEIIRRRFATGQENFNKKYQQEVDSWAFYEGTSTPPKLVGWSEADVMNAKDIRISPDPDMAGSYAAMQRAGRAAEDLAIRTNTAIITMIDGKIVRLTAGRDHQASSG